MTILPVVGVISKTLFLFKLLGLLLPTIRKQHVDIQISIIQAYKVI